MTERRGRHLRRCIERLGWVLLRTTGVEAEALKCQEKPTKRDGEDGGHGPKEGKSRAL